MSAACRQRLQLMRGGSACCGGGRGRWRCGRGLRQLSSFQTMDWAESAQAGAGSCAIRFAGRVWGEGASKLALRTAGTGGTLEVRSGTMIKKLTRHGNSLALVIDRPILDLLHIDGETPLDISTDGERLVVAPAKPSARRRKFEDAQRAAHGRYGKAFQKLAE